MRLRFSLPALLAFSAGVLLLGELHEQAHITAGRLLCGAYGPRDFNVWDLAPGCAQAHPRLSLLPTLMGPLFTFGVAGVGAWLTRSADVRRRGLGVTLVVGSGALFRLVFTALGSGDEPWALRQLTRGHLSLGQTVALATAGVAVLVLPSLWAAFRALSGPAWRRVAVLLGWHALVAVGFGGWVMAVLNPLLLEHGVLPAVHLLGTPDFVLVHSAVWAGVLASTGRHLLTVGREGPASPSTPAAPAVLAA
jgi:hypothetical protein